VSYNIMQNKQHRPIGVTIIAILTIIGGILLLLSGIALVVFGALFSGNPVGNATFTSPSSNGGAQFFGIIFAAIGGVLLIIGIGYLIMSYGLFKGKGWAWTITIILTIIGIAIQIVSTSIGSLFTASLNSANDVSSGIIGSIIGIAINIAVLYYLYRPHVKAHFGKAQQQPTSTI
jgi:magnesium-transporting ATPase (P-type)